MEGGVRGGQGPAAGWPLPGLLESRRLELLNLSFAEFPGSGCTAGVRDPPGALGLALRHGPGPVALVRTRLG